jgi:hypothetical protein
MSLLVSVRRDTRTASKLATKPSYKSRSRRSAALLAAGVSVLMAAPAALFAVGEDVRARAVGIPMDVPPTSMAVENPQHCHAQIA